MPEKGAKSEAQSRASVFPRLRDNVLELGPAERERVLLPSGLRGRVRQLMEESKVDFDLAVDTDDLRIRWKLKGGRRGLHEVNVPLGPWSGTAGGGRFTFEFVKPGAQEVMARSLLVRSHPRGAPSRGVLLAARYADPSEGRAAFKANARGTRPDPWSDAWRSVPRRAEIVGVVVIDRLLHGDPLGRERLAEAMGKRLPERQTTAGTESVRRARAERQLRRALRDWADNPQVDEEFESLVTQVGLNAAEPERRRSDVVDTLGVMWLSRIAVDAPYRGQSDGVGQALAEEAKSAVRRLPWNARSVEVIRTIDYDTEDERVRVDRLIQSASDSDGSAGDFLTRAGYVLVPEPLRSSPIRPLDEKGKCATNRRTTKKLYYYARTEEPR